MTAEVPATPPKDIGLEIRLLEKEHRDKVRDLMREWERESYYPRRRKLQEECGAFGHNWIFRDLGPLGQPWFYCGRCHLTECREDE